MQMLECAAQIASTIKRMYRVIRTARGSQAGSGDQAGLKKQIDGLQRQLATITENLAATQADRGLETVCRRLDGEFGAEHRSAAVD